MTVKSSVIIVPTRNGGEVWKKSCEAIFKQKLETNKTIIFDSSSTDNTASIAMHYGFKVIGISPEHFNHGGTRNSAVKFIDENVDFFIFITQDAILTSPSAISELLLAFDDERVAAVCGRQIPHSDANPLAAHARLYNYSLTEKVFEKKDIPRDGIKVAFVSNSFTAYRASVFKTLGGFPEDVILGEDMYLAAQMILADYRIRYCPKASVNHSHNYTPAQEFKRYFDIGVFHASEPWIQQNFGGAGGEGMKFLISEFKYLLKNAPLWIPRACFTNLCKIVGYKLGKNYRFIPKKFRPMLSMCKAYWFQKER